ncbi:MAG: hypothetical protein JJU29_15780 [Verrucomicrobia bacterium]|nr:hypothetical protein [Verrucomicrobiota bacterium]MCH8514004.1 hypothetical protein [Kiritimatiellia bacterium]
MDPKANQTLIGGGEGYAIYTAVEKGLWHWGFMAGFCGNAKDEFDVWGALSGFVRLTFGLVKSAGPT